ncbi:hypothetical protein HQO42_05345 [Rhodococcus fascians]|nr:hypothetical protein [Rhodococcus fascians]MBY4236570.1 hypothetical protein [Rhodococcus fascians]MBY4252064.1 hypothetical protein [Rhodococcus fascians]MBY4267915.1 hypothetical protein [Rhodococcus fascians]
MISLDTIRSLRPSRRGWIALAATAVIITGTSTAVAFTQLKTSTAEYTPVDIKVEDHEQRLTKNESDIAETKDRVDGVEQQTESNTNAIHEVQKQVVVVEGKADAAVNQSRQAQPAIPAPAPAPQPEPVKTVNLRLIVAVQAVQQPQVWQCNYTLEIGRVISPLQGDACSPVGSEISDDLATVYGVR